MSALQQILNKLGLTDAQAATLLPNGPDSPANSFPAALITTPTDTRTWAEREKEKDDRGWTKVR